MGDILRFIGRCPCSFFSNKNVLIVNTQDLNVHAINASDGSKKWKVKPTSRIYQSGDPNQDGAQFESGWPVIAEQHGIVFVRYRLDWNTLWTWSPYPNTNSTIRANLQSQPNQQALFALSLDDGRKMFIPAVGNGGAGDGGYLPMGTQPVIKQLANGQEVAYIIWRNGLACGGCSTAGNCGGQWCDGRSDATMGEMVLDDFTVSGYQAGDVRFVRAIEIRTDEMMNISMVGNTIFHSHWLINSAHRITDRNDNKGNTFINPIETTNDPFVIWRQCDGTNTCNYPGCTANTVCGISCVPTSSRYCSQGLYSYGDSRSYPPGFYEYNNDMNSGSTPFTIAAGSTILVKTNDGAILAFVNGNPAADIGSATQISQVDTIQQVLGATSLPQIKPEDALNYVNQYVMIEGRIRSVVNNLPKAIYIGFSDPHDGNLLLRIFDKDSSRFGDLPFSLQGKKVRVTGKVRLYWPENIDPEIVLEDPRQLEIVE